MTTLDSARATTAAPASTLRDRISRYGPGLTLAIGSVGAGDMVTSLNGAEKFGMGLLWAVLVGVLVKYTLTEAVGRLQLGSDRSLMGNLGRAGRWLPSLFLVVVLVVALLYGAGLSSVAALAVTAMAPVLPALPTTIVIGLVSGVLVIVNRYSRFETMMIAMSAILVVGMGLLAVLTLQNMDSPGIVASTATVSLPEGSVFAVLALIGGVGGGVGLGFYGYWIQEKGWTGREFLGTVRRDTALCYILIFGFAVAMAVIGTGLLYATGESLAGTEGLANLAGPVAAMAGGFARVVFLIVFFFIVFSSIVAGFNGIAYLAADGIRVLRGIPEAEAARHVSTRSPVFRGSVLFMMLATIVVSAMGAPVQLVLLYAATGALFLPLLAAALLWLLNGTHVAKDLRNGPLSNIVLVTALVLFGLLAVLQLMEVLS
ncbi:Nramp family divalent metal transporter [Ornithinimicrobium cavernae]|uniref:Nramp family divalent metal transporter n=1 Tax=Ornithinimicrobium cavernae TaxID=2666047 RepID=UPI000D6894A5|nr:Nramp family divalent metal transporter [Ornithinimicrobium cavernae]